LSKRNRKSRARESGAVVVVGTTPDYVAKLYGEHRGTLVFLMDDRFKDSPFLDDVPPSSLLFAPTGDPEEAYKKTRLFLESASMPVKGMACFDCESLLLASQLASRLRLRFPASQAILRSRNKFESGRAWSGAGVASPAAILASDLDRTLRFFRVHGEDIVLKPVSGSGSELLFHCKGEDDVRRAVAVMEEELPRRRTNPLFQPFPHPLQASSIDPCREWVVEEFISGQEFSCDFVCQDGEIRFIRETGKVKAVDRPFGSVLAYTFPPRYPAQFRKETLAKVLKKAVGALGFDWGYFMVDYIVRGGLPVLVEMTPRPGGDSIPDLIRIGAGRNVLDMYLDFVCGKLERFPEDASLVPESFASINLFAPKEGVISHLDGSGIISLPHVKSFFFKKKAGDRIVLPPKDYDNRLLGYCVVALEPRCDIPSECRRLEERLAVTISDDD
jgi:biotin carboxylase